MVKLEHVQASSAPKPVETASGPEKPRDPPARPERREQAETSPEQLLETAQQLREALAEARAEAWRVGIHEDEETGSLVIEIRDAEGEVVKQYPPEKVLNLQRKLADLAGMVVDEAP